MTSDEAARSGSSTSASRSPLEEFEERRRDRAAAREALEEGASKLVDELRALARLLRRPGGRAAIERVVLCGPGSTIPGLAAAIETGLGLAIEVASPAALSPISTDEDAARLTVSYGLALED